MSAPSSVNLRGAVPHFYIRIGGDLATDEMQHIQELTIESSLHMPDVATLILRDPTPLIQGQSAYRFTDDRKGKFVNGQDMTITIKVEDNQEENVFDGEIVEVESQLMQHGQRLVVRAYDRLHKLSRGTHTRTFQNCTDMDVVKKIAGSVGLSAKVGPASYVHDYIIQSNQTNLDFLRDRASKLGYLLYVDGKDLHCEPMGSQGHAGPLQWGVNLIEFSPRMSSLDQARSTLSSGWDPQRKQRVEGKVDKGSGEPEVAARGEEDLSEPYFKTDEVVRHERLAEHHAKGSADERRQKVIEASGVAGGHPKMTAGMTVDVDGVSDRYSGKYTLSAVTHQFRTESGYTTEFTVSGGRAPDIAQTLAGKHEAKKQYGFVIGIVTNNEDPKQQGRVKVKFPWLSEKDESDWARVASVGGGKKRGIEWIPEVEDEVLIGFEMGDMHHPYVIGGLWNGKDEPPEPTSKVVKGGKTIRRVMYSRLGHKIILDDSDDKPHILIEDKTGENFIKIDSKTNDLTISVQGKIDINAQKGVNIDAGSGDVVVKGTNIKLN